MLPIPADKPRTLVQGSRHTGITRQIAIRFGLPVRLIAGRSAAMLRAGVPKQPSTKTAMRCPVKTMPARTCTSSEVICESLRKRTPAGCLPSWLDLPRDEPVPASVELLTHRAPWERVMRVVHDQAAQPRQLSLPSGDHEPSGAQRRVHPGCGPGQGRLKPVNGALAKRWQFAVGEACLPPDATRHLTPSVG